MHRKLRGFPNPQFVEPVERSKGEGEDYTHGSLPP